MVDSASPHLNGSFIEKRPTRTPDGRIEEIWPLPLDERFLAGFLTDVFENFHDRVTFGPSIPGAAYELKPPGKPVSVDLSGGFLTVHWGTRGHFHLCVGEIPGRSGQPVDPQVAGHLRPGRAELYRRLDRNELPVSWGFRMWNGHEEPQITLLFPNPYVTDDDRVTETPDWSRLGTWHTLLERYTGNPPDGRDEQGRGFANF